MLADFGAEASFQAATLRVKEHYGLLVPISALRQQTLRHGRAITALADPQKARAATQLITEMDGSMIPVIKPGGGHDRRKGERLSWQEVKLCCARPVGSVLRLPENRWCRVPLRLLQRRVPPTQCHRYRGRRDMLLLHEPCWIPVSWEGHRWIEDHREEARALGRLCPLGHDNSPVQATSGEAAPSR